MRGGIVATNAMVSAPRRLFRRHGDRTRRDGMPDPAGGHQARSRTSVSAATQARPHWYQLGSNVMTLRESVGLGLAISVLGFGGGVLAASPVFAQGNPERNVYFGQTHVHTSWSFDAYVFGNTITGPEEAYKYALGQPIKHPGGYMVQLKRPLDFQAVTDHAEYVGTVRLANDPSSDNQQAADCRQTQGPQQGRHPESLPFPRRLHTQEPADQGTARPTSGRQYLERYRRDRRQVLPAGEVHDVCGLRMDLNAEQQQHASERYLQGYEEGAGCSVQLHRLRPPRGSLGLDGWATPRR